MRRLIKKIKFILFKLQVSLAGEYPRAKIYSKYYGVKMGKNVRVTGTLHFPTESYLIEIGDDVTLTKGVTFHTHDGGVGVLRKELKGINIFGKIKIGNNVFIGSNSIILPNVEIGNNAVIGAGSVVTKNIPDNAVAAGNPAKIIRTIDEYRKKALETGIYIHETNPEKRKQEILKKIPEK